MKSVSVFVIAAVVWSVVFGTVSAQVSQPAAVDELLASMTLEEKVGQMFMVSFFGNPLNEPARDLLQTWKPGAVVLMKSNLGTPDRVTSMTNSIQQTLIDAGGLPALIAVDQEGGIIAHLDDGFTRWPVPSLLAATGSAGLAYTVGEAYAAEMRAVGINMNLAPVADLHTNRRNPIIGRRSFGSYPELVAPVLAGFVQGMQAGGVLATAKHFPGHGDTASDSHVELPALTHDRDRLDAVELVPFRAAIEADTAAVMVAHIWFSAFDPGELVAASLSLNIVTGLLRDELGYEGLIMPDAMDMDAIDLVYPAEVASLMAVQAGHDLILVGAHVSPVALAQSMQGVVDAVRRGEITEARIEASVRRILTAKAQYDLLDWQPLDPFTAASRIPLEEHAILLENMFHAGVTVVYDRNDLIALRDNTLVIFPASRPSIWAVCSQLSGLRPLGVNESPTDEQITWARSEAQRAEKVIVFTLNAETDPRQQALVEALPADKTVVVALWSPYDLFALPPVAAYVVAYSPLPASYPAACGVASGHQPALGQLSIALDAE